MPNRQILDNVLVAFKIMHKLKNQRKGKTGMMALKLDMRKAYDQVEWIFLQAVMEAMSFDRRWITLI